MAAKNPRTNAYFKKQKAKKNLQAKPSLKHKTKARTLNLKENKTAKTVDDAQIKADVIIVIGRSTGKPPESINTGDDLRENLNLSEVKIKAYGVPFTNIARDYNADVIITPKECSDCETVKDCIDLVTKKATKA